ncbi:hypothetical protein [Frankia sp. Cr2]|uniref:hypothetical protein n=1 Tax=Frankia sp. Cr2 TaxID=3073932 RepID=UPI002AD3EF57|nr:hypothetical protein [Frankia sp. Cr2]
MASGESGAALAHSRLVDLLRVVSTDDEYLRYRLRSAFRLARHLQRYDEIGEWARAEDVAAVARLLATQPPSWDAGETALEAFVRTDGGEHDRELLHLFHERFLRGKALLGPPGSAMAHHHVVPALRHTRDHPTISPSLPPDTASRPLPQSRGVRGRP